MKMTLLKSVGLLLALAGMAGAQQVSPGTVSLPIWTGRAIVFAQLDLSAFQLVQQNGVYILKATAAVPPPAPPKTPPPDAIYQLAAAQAKFTAACSLFDLYWNGVRQTAGVDFDVDATGVQISFRGDSAPPAGDVVTLAYRCVQ